MITEIQLDPNGYCNNRCWFCPVKYSPNPEYYIHQMQVDVLEKIILNCVHQKGKLLSNDFRHFWTAHYNEILLYQHLEEFFKILKKYNFTTTILSNGINLTPEKVELIKKYNNNIAAICLNVPAGEPIAYERYTESKPEVFNKIIENIKNAIIQLPEKVTNKTFNIMVNGVDDDYIDQRQDFLGENAPKIPFYDLHNQENNLKKIFPNLHIYKVGGLSDRSSHLSRYNIFKHSKIWTKRNEKVISCNATRMNNWLHINSRGETFLCCNDYNFEYIFGDLTIKRIEDVWESAEHKKMKLKAFSGICRTCGAAGRKNV